MRAVSAVETAMRPRTARLPQVHREEDKRPMFLPSSPDDPPEGLGPGSFEFKSGAIKKTD